MNRRSVGIPDIATQYLGEDPHREKWTLYSGDVTDGDIQSDTIVESGICCHGNVLILDHRIEFDDGAFEVSLIGIDPYTDGTSYEW